MKNSVMLIIGTRPEGIKMAPVYYALQQAHIPTLLCSTFQHTDLLHDVLQLFSLTPDIALNVMQPNQQLAYITHTILEQLTTIFLHYKPSLVLVQGDTSSSMAAAMAAFYLKIPIGHIEAGLRTNTIQTPFPEEMNRRFITMVSSWHFAPTSHAYHNLLSEGVNKDTVFCTGNTVVDALLNIQERLKNGTLHVQNALKTIINTAHQQNQKIIMLTMHRRESFGQPMINALQAIKQFAHDNPTTLILFPHHPNPHVIDAINHVALTSINNIKIIAPLSYENLIFLLLNTTIVLTDSGGIQEEAISLNKPVLILRESTERVEGINGGLAHLVGTNPTTITHALTTLLNTSKEHEHQTIYGDGTAATMIASLIKHHCLEKTPLPIQLEKTLKEVV